MTTKPTNPKDAVGVRKAPFSTVPMQVVGEAGLALLEGALKYGRHNYRVAGLRSSVYFDATMRHLTSWWEGEDIDPDSGLSHIAKAIASLLVLRDAQMNDMVKFDDRPPVAAEGWQAQLQAQAEELIDKYPEPVAPFVQLREIPVTEIEAPTMVLSVIVTYHLEVLIPTDGEPMWHRAKGISYNEMPTAERGLQALRQDQYENRPIKIVEDTTTTSIDHLGETLPAAVHTATILCVFPGDAPLADIQ